MEEERRRSDRGGAGLRLIIRYNAHATSRSVLRADELTGCQPVL